MQRTPKSQKWVALDARFTTSRYTPGVGERKQMKFAKDGSIRSLKDYAAMDDEEARAREARLILSEAREAELDRLYPDRLEEFA